jgi:hypothetical protein
LNVSTEHADFSTLSLVAIPAKERSALAVKSSAAPICGDSCNLA